MRGLAAGRSFVTTGPMLLVEFNGEPPGHTFAVADKPLSCRVTGTAASGVPLERIEIVVNGERVETLNPANTQTSAGGFSSRIDSSVPINGTSWVAVRCFERHANGRVRFAHTAPVHFDVPGQPLRPRKVEVQVFIERLEQELARNRGVLNEAAVREYDEALAIYRRLAESGR
jgi:hypothetical protein